MRPQSSARQLLTHGVDHGLVIGLAEDGAARNEGVSPRVGDASDVVDLDTPIHLQADVAT